jgi:hypothetical protein
VAFIDKYEPKRKDPAGDTSMRTPFDEVHSKLIAKVPYFLNFFSDCLACANRRWFTEGVSLVRVRPIAALPSADVPDGVHRMALQVGG